MTSFVEEVAAKFTPHQAAAEYERSIWSDAFSRALKERAFGIYATPSGINWPVEWVPSVGYRLLQPMINGNRQAEYNEAFRSGGYKPMPTSTAGCRSFDAQAEIAELRKEVADLREAINDHASALRCLGDQMDIKFDCPPGNPSALNAWRGPRKVGMSSSDAKR